MTNSNLVLSQPEAEATGMVAPGQEALLDEFVAEQEQEEQQRQDQRHEQPVLSSECIQEHLPDTLPDSLQQHLGRVTTDGECFQLQPPCLLP